MYVFMCMRYFGREIVRQGIPSSRYIALPEPALVKELRNLRFKGLGWKAVPSQSLWSQIMGRTEGIDGGSRQTF